MTSATPFTEQSVLTDDVTLNDNELTEQWEGGRVAYGSPKLCVFWIVAGV